MHTGPTGEHRTRVSPTTVIRLAWAAVGVVILALPAAAAPSPHEIIDRVAAASASVPNMTADVVFKVWRRKPTGNQSADCEYTGTMVVQGGHPAVKVARGGTSVVCSAINHYAVGKLFDASEPLAAFLDRFDFTVAGDKQVGADAYYRLEGPARDPKGNPHAMSAWIDYNNGLITQGTLNYDWGTVDVQQQYAQVNNVSVLARQNVQSSKFAAVLEVDYSNFHISP